ncbi:MAG: META domain-containing protein [Spirulinaceae cyanobacterium RM2_2_10]|nr:META domain-containing protein [Spirulinaceae cyanobacterium SM2_1_0]NJO20869.1 META domain-containing protein [Spirulinaceae cyanobacterium RM2_2_10]
MSKPATIWHFGWLIGATITSTIPLLPAAAIAAPMLWSQAARSLSGSWQLVGWGDADDLTPPVVGTTITADFDGTRLTGSTGCNRYFTTYTTDGMMLSLGAIATSRRACPEAIAAQELQYLSALENLQTYALTAGGTLELRYQTETGSGVLVFRRQAIPGLW